MDSDSERIPLKERDILIGILKDVKYLKEDFHEFKGDIKEFKFDINRKFESLGVDSEKSDSALKQILDRYDARIRRLEQWYWYSMGCVCCVGAIVGFIIRFIK